MKVKVYRYNYDQVLHKLLNWSYWAHHFYSTPHSLFEKKGFGQAGLAVIVYLSVFQDQYTQLVKHCLRYGLVLLTIGMFVLSISSCRGQRSVKTDQLLDQQENTVIFMGNSITDAWPRLRPEFFAGRPWMAKGFPGLMAGEILAQFRQDVLARTPKVVIILAGTNDMTPYRGVVPVEVAFENICSMAELARSSGIIPVLCCVPPVMAHPETVNQDITDRIMELNELIRVHAEQNGWSYIDYFDAMADEHLKMKEQLSYDGIHPNPMGYAVMEGLVEAALIDLFSKTK